MSPLFKVFLATTAVALALFLGFHQFLGSTESYSDSIDMDMLAYTRPKANSDKAQDTSRKVYKIVSEKAPDREVNSVKLTVTEQQELGVEELVENEMEDLNEGLSGETGEEEEAETEKVISDEKAAQIAALDRGESVELDHQFADKGTVENGTVEEGEGTDGTDDELTQEEKVAAEKDEETEVEAHARMLREKLGIKKRKEPTRAVDVKLALANECSGTGVALAAVSVQFRHDSPTPRGASLQQLELLVEEFRRCPEGGAFQFTENELGKVDASPSLTQMRFDELKYFFIQRSVPRTALRYPKST